MCCQKCEDQHEGHNKAYFKDQYIYDCGNYENVEQISNKELQSIGTVHSSGDQFMLKSAQPQNQKSGTHDQDETSLTTKEDSKDASNEVATSSNLSQSSIQPSFNSKEDSNWVDKKVGSQEPQF